MTQAARRRSDRSTAHVLEGPECANGHLPGNPLGRTPLLASGVHVLGQHEVAVPACSTLGQFNDRITLVINRVR